MRRNEGFVWQDWLAGYFGSIGQRALALRLATFFVL